MAAGDSPIPLVTGDNPVGEARTVKCPSVYGCLVGIAPSIEINGAGVYECAYVDGSPFGVRPKCGTYDFDSILDKRQHAIVSQGQHTFQIIVHSDNSSGQIEDWEVDYSVYNLHQALARAP
jgi:hypothetical protein